MLTNFDIFATAGGEFKAVDEPFTATANSNGTITIQFVTVKDNAQVNGIEISPAGGGTTTNTVTVTNPGSQTATVGTAASLQVARQRLRVRPDPRPTPPAACPPG